MAQQGSNELPTKVVVLFTDGGDSLVEGLEEEDQIQALRDFAGLVEDVIHKVLDQPQFRHIQLVTVDTSEEPHEDAPSNLCIGFADEMEEVDGENQISSFTDFVDIQGLVTGTSEFPDSLTDKAVADEGLVKFEDEDLSQKLKSVFSKAGVEKLFNKFLSQAGEEAVQDAMAAASDAVLEEGEEPATNVDLFSVLELATAHIIAVAGVSPAPPSLLGRGVGLVGGLFAAPRAALRAVNKRVGNVQRLWWRLEDFVVDGGKFAVKFAIKAARPVLVGVVLHRVLRTIDRSRSLENRMATLPVEKRMPYLYKSLLGPDWEAQMEEDMRKALADVDEGLVTDDIAAEKRLVSAAMLRRLELEDWDKERMKNFYLASYGGLKWFEFMENALHNPLFITARGWTDPVQNWIGRNQTFANDLPKTIDGDIGEYALSLIEKDIGRSLNAEERARILARAEVKASDMMSLQ